jgi:hypothetical protein
MNAASMANSAEPGCKGLFLTLSFHLTVLAMGGIMPDQNELELPAGVEQPPLETPMDTVSAIASAASIDPVESNSIEIPDPLPPLDEQPVVSEASPVVDEPVTPAVEPVTSWPIDSPRLTSPTSSATRKLPASIWLLALLIPYAIGSTIGIAYLFQQQQRNKQPHILESIPDQGLYEDYFEARRKVETPPLSKAGEKLSAGKIIPPTEPVLPEIVPIKLNEKRRVGMLTVTPMGVKREKLKYRYRQGSKDLDAGEVLVLILQVKNEGPLIFHPDDPTFNRTLASESKAPIYTFLEHGRDRYYGIINDPSLEELELPSLGSLLPGESGTLQVVASKSGDGKRVADLKPGIAVWRVHLRKGKEEISLTNGRKRSVWVTTVVPVEVKLD